MSQSVLFCVVAIYALMSVVTVVAYAIDKRRAMQGRYRISERTLHLLELCGGWPGAIVGQAWFRHKRRKLAYMTVIVAIIVLHVAAWIGVYWLSFAR